MYKKKDKNNFKKNINMRKQWVHGFVKSPSGPLPQKKTKQQELATIATQMGFLFQEP